MAKLTCRLRKYRKSAQLSQLELARLLGLTSQGSLCEIEAGLKRPSARVAFACEIIFGISGRELFPGLYGLSERTVERSAVKLESTLSPRRSAVQDHLVELKRRLNTHSPV